MGYITEDLLRSTVDLPIALSSTDLRMGDWIVLATVRLISPMRLIYRAATVSISASTVDPDDITSGNKIFGNLGLVYLVLRLNYTGGNPGEAGGLDTVVADNLGVSSRDISSPLVLTTSGVYSWILANNMQPSTDTTPIIPLSTDIDFRVSVNGAVRLEFDTL